jgi:CheY-like chemotaxis protein
MPSGGVLSIETDTVDVSEAELAINELEKPGSYVTIAVSDTGGGIPPEVREHIFEPFFTTKSPGQGTGLGLATVKAIIQQLGGTITVYSEGNMGTVFRLYIPLHGADPARLVASSAELDLSKGGSETVLVAEDEGPVRNAVRRMLERAGYHVLEASSGAEALRVYDESKKIDVLLTDMMMPDMSGAKLAEQLRARSARLPVLFMSGYTANSTFLHGFDSTRATFIQKPFTGAALMKGIRDVLAGDQSS